MSIGKWIKENITDLKKPVSQGGAGRAVKCARFFMFKDKWGMYPKSTPYSRGMKVGSMIHLFLKYGQDNKEKVDKIVYDSHQKLLLRIKAGEDLSGELMKEANDMSSSYSTAGAVMEIYWGRFPIKDYVKTIFREEELTGDIETPAGNLPVIAILDWVVQDERNGSIWIRDTKSTGKKVDNILVGYPFSFQFKFYHMMMDRTEYAKDLSGFILDIVKTPAIKLCGKDIKGAAKLECTPAEFYTQRVKEWYEDNLRGNDDYMTSRGLSFVEPLWTPEFEKSLGDIYNLWNEDCGRIDCFHRDQTKTSCYSYERRCPYYDLCTSAAVTWPSQIEGRFEFVKKDQERLEL